VQGPGFLAREPEPLERTVLSRPFYGGTPARPVIAALRHS
jgi:hypothetical protein